MDFTDSVNLHSIRKDLTNIKYALNKQARDNMANAKESDGVARLSISVPEYHKGKPLDIARLKKVYEEFIVWYLRENANAINLKYLRANLVRLLEDLDRGVTNCYMKKYKLEVKDVYSMEEMDRVLDEFGMLYKGDE